MKIRIYEKGALREEIFEEGFVCGVRYGKINAFNVGEGYFSPCCSREILVGGKTLRFRITTSPALVEVMEIIKRFHGMKMLEVEVMDGSIKIEIEV